MRQTASARRFLPAMIDGGTWEGAHARHEAAGVRQPVRPRGRGGAAFDARAAGDAGIGFLDPRSPDALADRLRGFRQGLKNAGFAEGQNAAIEYRWAENQTDRLPELAADLVRRQVAGIVTPGGLASAMAAKAATTTIPIVFVVADDPVRLGLVASLARPGGNMTGINFLSAELVAKRLEFLREVVPQHAVWLCWSILPMRRELSPP
jgi:ABC-type uncharacterized transport system substrate-binding protein